MSEQAIGAIFDSIAEDLGRPDGVTTTTTECTGIDGNTVALFVSRPANADGELPAVVHLHGGGMAIASAADAAYVGLREHLAATGLVVVGVEFRNSSAKLGAHPYPAGLNDCASAARWVAAHRRELGVSHLVVSGESGGGNLTLTLAHKAKREGWIGEIAGFYAQCPFISNRWLDACEDLPSLEENDGYFISREQAALLGSLYDPDGAYADDATCWAAMATDDELSGLPRMSFRSTSSIRFATRGCSTTADWCAPGCPRWAAWWPAPATAVICCSAQRCPTCSGPPSVT